VFSLLRCYAPDLRAIVAANGHIEIESHLGEKKVKWHTEKNSVVLIIISFNTGIKRKDDKYNK